MNYFLYATQAGTALTPSGQPVVGDTITVGNGPDSIVFEVESFPSDTDIVTNQVSASVVLAFTQIGPYDWQLKGVGVSK